MLVICSDWRSAERKRKPLPPAININHVGLEVVNQYQQIRSPEPTPSHWTPKSTKALAKRLNHRLSLQLVCEEIGTFTHKEWKLNTFHVRFLLRILGVTWQNKVTNNDMPNNASMFTIFHQKRIRCVGWFWSHFKELLFWTVSWQSEKRLSTPSLWGHLQTGHKRHVI